MSNSTAAGAAGGVALMALIAGLKIGLMRGCDDAGRAAIKTTDTLVSQADNLVRPVTHTVDEIIRELTPSGHRASSVSGIDELKKGMDFAKRVLGEEQQRALPLNEVMRSIRQDSGTEQPWQRVTDLGEPAAASEQWKSLGLIKGKYLRDDVPPPSSFKSMRLIGILPKGEGYANVFHQPATAAMANQVATAEKKLANLGKLAVLSDPEHAAGMIYEQIAEASPDELVVIVGHSVNDGERLMLPNNTYVSVQNLHSLATLMRRRCLVVTCHSPDLKLTGEIALEEGVQMCIAAKGIFDTAGLQPVALSSISDRMRRELQLGRVRNAALSGTVWVTGGGGSLYLVRVRTRQSADEPAIRSPYDAPLPAVPAPSVD